MKGFTLLEVMIALAITAGVLLTVISSVNHHLSRVAQDTEETTAVLLGRALLEDPECSRKTENEGDFAPDHPEHKWAREITKTEIPQLNQIRLTVSWNDDKKSLSLVQYAPQNVQ